MKRRRDKTRRLTDKFIGHTNEEIDEPLLVGRLNCKEFIRVIMFIATMTNTEAQ